MPWKLVTEADVMTFARSARAEAAWDADDDPQKAAWFETMRAGVVEDIRRKCGNSGRFPLDSNPDTVPGEFHPLACARILVDILGRVGPTAGTGGEGGADPMALTVDQRDKMRRLEADLNLVAKGELGISLPATVEINPTVATSGGGAALLSGGPSDNPFARMGTT